MPRRKRVADSAAAAICLRADAKGCVPILWLPDHLAHFKGELLDLGVMFTEEQYLDGFEPAIHADGVDL